MLPVPEIYVREFVGKVLESQQPALVHFWAEWSQPCRRLESVLEEVAAVYEGRVRVVSINADACPELAISYWIQSIPTLLFFVGGSERARFVGTASREAICAKLDTLLA